MKFQRDRRVTARLRLRPLDLRQKLITWLSDTWRLWVRATRGVNQQRQRVVRRCRQWVWPAAPCAFDPVSARSVSWSPSRPTELGRLRRPRGGCQPCRGNQYDQPGRGVTGQHFDGDAKIVDMVKDKYRLGLVTIGRNPVTGALVCSGTDGAQPDPARCPMVVCRRAVWPNLRKPDARPDRGRAQRGGQCAGEYSSR